MDFIKNTIAYTSFLFSWRPVKGKKGLQNLFPLFRKHMHGYFDYGHFHFIIFLTQSLRYFRKLSVISGKAHLRQEKMPDHVLENVILRRPAPQSVVWYTIIGPRRKNLPFPKNRLISTIAPLKRLPAFAGMPGCVPQKGKHPIFVIVDLAFDIPLIT